MNKFLVIFIFILCANSTSVFGQGEDCSNATQLTNVINYCSGTGSYTNVGSVPSATPLPACWSTNVTEDVWFSFTAIASDILVSVRGSGGGGTMNRPRIALYGGSCSGTLNVLACTNGILGPGITQLTAGSLTPAQYIILE